MIVDIIQMNAYFVTICVVSEEKMCEKRTWKYQEIF